MRALQELQLHGPDGGRECPPQRAGADGRAVHCLESVDEQTALPVEGGRVTECATLPCMGDASGVRAVSIATSRCPYGVP